MKSNVLYIVIAVVILVAALAYFAFRSGTFMGEKTEVMNEGTMTQQDNTQPEDSMQKDDTMMDDSTKDDSMMEEDSTQDDSMMKEDSTPEGSMEENDNMMEGDIQAPTL